MPYLSSTIFVVTAVVGLGLTMGAFALLMSSLFPKAVDRAEQDFRAKPVASVLVGALVLMCAFGVVAVLVAVPSPAIRALGIIAGACVFVASITGLAGIASHLGVALAAEGAPRFTRIRRGMTVLELSMMLPIVGWFFVLPLALAASMGVVARGLFARSPRAPHVQAYGSNNALFAVPPSPYAAHESFTTQAEAYRGPVR